jgi:hypothetical protein
LPRRRERRGDANAKGEDEHMKRGVLFHKW